MKTSVVPRSSVGMALLAAVAIPVLSTSVDAQTTTFTIDGTEGVHSYSQTTNGITLNFLANPTQGGGGHRYAFGNFGPANHDLDLSNGALAYDEAFTFSFSQDVQIVSYNVGVLGFNGGNPVTSSFTLSGPDSSASTGNTLGTTGSHLINGDYEIDAGDIGSWVASFPNGGEATIRSITVATPEPGTLSLMGVAFGGLALSALRRRRARSAA